METDHRQLVGSDPNVILMRQTCGQCWSRAAESKRQALAFYFPMQFWYMIPTNMYRTVTSRSVHFHGICQMQLCSADFRLKKKLAQNSLELLPATLFVSTTTNSMESLVIWIPLRIRVCSRITQPQLKSTNWYRSLGGPCRTKMTGSKKILKEFNNSNSWPVSSGSG